MFICFGALPLPVDLSYNWAWLPFSWRTSRRARMLVGDYLSLAYPWISFIALYLQGKFCRIQDFQLTGIVLKHSTLEYVLLLPADLPVYDKSFFLLCPSSFLLFAYLFLVLGFQQFDWDVPTCCFLFVLGDSLGFLWINVGQQIGKVFSHFLKIVNPFVSFLFGTLICTYDSMLDDLL